MRAGTRTTNPQRVLTPEEVAELAYARLLTAAHELQRAANAGYAFAEAQLPERAQPFWAEHRRKLLRAGTMLQQAVKMRQTNPNKWPEPPLPG
jgi:hypothetical protein